MARRPLAQLIFALTCCAVYAGWYSMPLAQAAPTLSLRQAGSAADAASRTLAAQPGGSPNGKPEQKFGCKEGSCNRCYFDDSEVEHRETKRLDGVVGGGLGDGITKFHRRAGTRVSRSELDARGIRFLQVGGDWWNKCGDGWLNADAIFTKLPTGFVCEDWRTGRNIMRLDAGGGFPLEDESVEVVYTEHMFEHMLPVHGAAFLTEAYRVLKPGGLIRVTTPDLQKYIVSAAAYYASGTLDSFLAEHASRFPPMGKLGKPYSAATVINNIFRNYEHQWIYDYEELVRAAVLGGVPKEAVRRSSRMGADLPAFFLAAARQATTLSTARSQARARESLTQCWLEQEVREGESLYVTITKPLRG